MMPWLGDSCADRATNFPAKLDALLLLLLLGTCFALYLFQISDELLLHDAL
jgi:hypothetical protein